MNSLATRGRPAPFVLQTLLLLLTAASTPPPALGQERTPPAAKVVPRPDTTLRDVRVDNYYWLRDDARKNPDVLAYLEAENAYTAEAMRHTEELQKTLYDEMLGRIKETDLSVPERVGRYFYYTRTEKGKQYPIHARKMGSLSAPEEVMLDENVLAAGKGYFRVGVTHVSPNDSLLAFTIDTTGGERYLLVVKDLATGRMLPDSITSVNYSVQWARDNRTLFYGIGDHANRAYKIFRHTLGGSASDALVFHELNELFDVSLSTTKSREYLLMSVGSFTSSEVHYLRADRPMDRFVVIQPRMPDVLYDVDHHGDRFLILTNEGATNFKLMQAPVTLPGRSSWRELVLHSDTVLLDAIDVFRDYLVLYERRNALRQIRVMPFAGGDSYYVDFPEPVYTVRGARNPEYDTKILRFNYTSMVTPNSVYDFDMARRSRELKKQTDVLGGYDPTRYATERAWASAHDGTRVPLSLVFKKPLVKTGSRPLLLYAYGSYGSSTDPTFSSNVLSLLDRGVIYAIAHIRGGQEMGRAWYDQGKLLNKKNTFTDFIAAAEHLVSEQYTSKDRLAIRGGSAGGLLIGAVVNMRPDLFRVAVADVPFVDVIATMKDASIPLTASEWEQWGDPRQEKYYAYMKSYSPYDNVEHKAYPALLVTAGLNDPRVGYWEPAKWVARLRAMKTDDNVLLLKTNMGAGHGGASGRYDALKEMAFRYAFILDQLGVSGRGAAVP